jgi:dTDP-4-amino-4,6-dideoxygalactose transaminase
MYYVLLPSLEARTALIHTLKDHDIHPVFHYVPLHSAPAGLKYGRVGGDLSVTESVADRLLRLPLWLGLEEYQHSVVRRIVTVLSE